MAAFSGQPVDRKFGFVLLSAAIFLVTIIVMAQSLVDTLLLRSAQSSDTSQFGSPPDELSLLSEMYLKHIVRPTIPVDSPRVSLFGAFNWNLSANAQWTEPLGEQLCIIDLDSRKFNESGQLWGNRTLDWDEEVHGLSLGIINHWLYAKIHGYKYYYVEIEEFEDRRASWKKPIIIPEILKKHKTCIYIDSDAIFPHLNLPVEWLMNYWSINPEIDSLTLALDPDKPYNEDKFGKAYLNTGFIIAQNTAQTFEIMDEWRDCPEEGGRHPECTQFKVGFMSLTDQAGFGTYIRYDFPENIKELPCSEANGYPESNTTCIGTLVKHLWSGKDTWLKVAVGQQLRGDLLPAFHRRFVQEKGSYWITERDLMAAAHS